MISKNTTKTIINFSTIKDIQPGQNVTVGGFVHTIRDHGNLIFVDLRNGGEFLQCVIDPERNQEAFSVASQLHNEYVVQIEGTLIERSEDRINNEITNGKVELSITTLTIVSKSKLLPFELHNEDNIANEDLRLKYRYLDLRRKKLQTLLALRHKLVLKTRNWFDKEGFVEVATPILANSSPEGARDYLVPSRLHPGKFYALPQAPQQFKQLLMVGGVSKYFQIAPCFRDEDPRADRALGDFYQIDLEMAWAGQEDIFELWEKYCREVLVDTSLTSKTLLDQEGFVRLTYDEAMEKYGSDKPDLRCKLAWQDARKYFVSSGFSVFADIAQKPSGRVQALVLKGLVDTFSRAQLDKLQEIGRSFGLPGLAYIQYTKEGIKSPILKFLSDEEQQNLTQGLQAQLGDLVLFLAHENKSLVYKAQNEIRMHIAHKENMIDETVLKFAWIIDFPFFEEDEKTGKLDFAHNPFGIWQCQDGLDEMETLIKYKEEGKLLDLRAYQYDITCNGYEISSGGVRNHLPQGILEAFKLVGYDEEEVRSKFPHMLEAYEFGSPRHAGFAPGLERLLMILTGETNIREVIAFPKNGSGVDLLTNSPSYPTAKQLKELSLEIDDD